MDQIDYKALLLDLNGVLFSENQPLKGAIQIVDWIRHENICVRYLTNTTTMTCEQLSARLMAMGLHISPNEIISPAQSAVFYLRKQMKNSVHLVVDDRIKTEFGEFVQSHTNPDYIVIGDIDDRWNYKILNKLFEMISYGAEIVALHKGKYWQVKGNLHIDIGAFVAGLEYASGKQAIVVGKPSRSFYQMALADMKMAAEDVIMVGDDIYADIGGAQDAGIHTCLVKTGKYRKSLVSGSGIIADQILDGIGDVKKWIEQG